MPINVSVIYSPTKRKRFPCWFRNLNRTTCCLHEMTTKENDPERFKSKRKECIQASVSKKKSRITILVTDKAFFVRVFFFLSHKVFFKK